MLKNIAIATVLLSACSIADSSHLYIGPLSPLSGTCDPAAQAQLVVRGSSIVFAPNSGTLVLSGTKLGSLVTASRTLAGAERRPYALKFEGVLNGSQIVGIYQDNRCRYRVSLHSASI